MVRVHNLFAPHSKITANPLVRISRMPDPIRDDQSILPFEPIGRNDDDEDDVD